MSKKYILQTISFTILLVSIGTVASFIQYASGIPVANTTLWWIINSVILISFLIGKTQFFDKANTKNMNVVMWYLLWNVFSILRGTLIAENYWDWKGLITNTMSLLVPIVAYAASNENILQHIIRYYIKYALPLLFILAAFMEKGAWGFYLVPFSLLIFFMPILNFKWNVLISVFVLLGIFVDFGNRSSVIKLSVPILLLSIYYFRYAIPLSILELLRKVLFIAPLILFFFAVTGVFNVFKISDYVKGDYAEVKKDDKGQVVREDLTADTRTFLYLEVLQTAQKYNTWIFGRSPARGNETEAFADVTEIVGRKERLGNEVAILNIFTWTGAVGVVLYMIAFYQASSLAINSSRNIFIKLIGIFIAFRWLYAWAEDINGFTLTSFFLWFMIGLCFSRSFRNMTDMDILYWARGIFDKKFRVAGYKRQLIKHEARLAPKIPAEDTVAAF